MVGGTGSATDARTTAAHGSDAATVAAAGSNHRLTRPHSQAASQVRRRLDRIGRCGAVQRAFTVARSELAPIATPRCHGHAWYPRANVFSDGALFRGEARALGHAGAVDVHDRVEVVGDVLGGEEFLRDAVGVHHREPRDAAHTNLENLTVERT